MTKSNWAVAYRGKPLEILQNEKGWETAAWVPGARKQFSRSANFALARRRV